MCRARNPVIAVVDTGIDENVSYKEDIIGNVTFYIENQTIYVMTDCNDIIGHGTTVASIIKKYCPQANLFIINIYRNGPVTSSFLFIEALKFLLTIDVDIINISLSVNSEDNISEIRSVLKDLHYQGKIIVVSVKNGQRSSFPAESSYCLGVLGLADVPIGKFIVDEQKKVQVITSRLPEKVETLYGQMIPFGGNSKAAACTTGCIASIIMEKQAYGMSMDSICRELKKNV